MGFINRLKFIISPHKRFINAHLQIFTEYIRSHSDCTVDTNCTILDAGGGESPYKYIFTPISSKYISIDLNKSNNVNVVGSVKNLPVKVNAFDIILFLEVLEHIYETKDVLNELNQSLKIGGYLILTTPLLIGVHDSIDYYRFTETSLRRLLNENGFEIIVFKNRGGIFASIGGLLFNIPSSVSNNKLISCILSFLLIPPIMLTFFLDRFIFYTNKNFTLGYDILALKRR